jgi:uncharacterized protein YndB with AHSA1/START domain
VATNKRFMPVPPQAVWDVLADPGEYGYWVVGSKVIRDADADWPAPGSKFHHTIGVGPFKVSDHTVALEAERPHRIVLRAKGRPIGIARVTLTMTPRDGGTVVQMVESPDGVYKPLVLNPLLHLLTLGRNSESLMRLEELAVRKVGR